MSEGTVAKNKRLNALCEDCAHPWSEYAGADFDASSDGVCSECAYEDQHEGLSVHCRRHAPEAAVSDIRAAFVVEVDRGTSNWVALLRTVRRDAAEVELDIPEDGDWPAAAKEAAAALRLRAGIDVSTSPTYSSIPRLAVDDAVWAAFEVLARRSYDATVLRSSEGWDPVLELSDEGATVVATLTPDGWVALTAELGTDALRPIPRRRRFWSRKPRSARA